MSIRILVGDCRVVMATFEPYSVDAIVTDPPYGLEFMGKEWDRLGATVEPVTDTKNVLGNWTTKPFGGGGNRVRYGTSAKSMQQWHEAWATEASRVLKPGGYLLAFGGTRTFHRLTCAIEDAGFEIRDCLSWLYGSGFPKSLDVSKAIDKAAGAEREVVGTTRKSIASMRPGEGNFSDDAYEWKPEFPRTGPATDAARRWNGWGTALKPAWEPIIMARKPLAESTVAGNILKYGTGAINVDGCRIEGKWTTWRRTDGSIAEGGNMPFSDFDHARNPEHPAGRWPANVCLDEDAAAALDAMSGSLTSGAAPNGLNRNADKFRHAYSRFSGQDEPDAPIYGDTGGASRFFYTAKASRSERGNGNNHPTVKPIDLMRWLVRMVTPPSGTVLDPFMGSGSTGIAADREGFSFIGIEQDPEYAKLARRRIVGDNPMFTDIEPA